MSKLIYVMGRGHSGSTILDILLGEAKNACGLSELVSGLARFEKDICSCEQPIRECEFWSKVKAEFEEQGRSWEEVYALVGQANVKRFPSMLLWGRAQRDALNEIDQSLVRAISKVSGCEYVVDSSKEVTRGLLLARGGKTKIVHILRSPLEVIESNLYRIDRGENFRFMRRNFRGKRFRYLFVVMSAFGWSVGFWLAMLVARFAKPERYLPIYYNQLYADPRKVLEGIGQFADLDLEDVIRQIEAEEPIKFFHRFAGNRIRFKKEVVFRDAREKRSLRWFERLLVEVLTFPAFHMRKKRFR